MPDHHSGVSDIVQSVTGWGVTDVELLRVGERSLALARLFNAREGFTADDDAHPARFAEPLGLAGEEGEALPAERMREAVDTYYELQGWDKRTGAPTRVKLLELSLDWAVDVLDQVGAG